ncbi:MAG: CoB--CoM heterodisulfide reductase iron-sulfur subunit B family protein [Anaerolineae bacterium]|nr:CoB--CoM heterodisulfide reductase iron-sulfur subunit B family protein [Anaerolineae bacterium]
MSYGYYPGCSLEGISEEYDISIRSLFEVLDIPVNDIEDWICCGTMAAPSLSPLLGLAAPLSSVIQAKHQNFEKIIAPCSECLYHFKRATLKVDQDQSVRTDLSEVMGESLDHLPVSIHPLELLYHPDYEALIKSRLVPERDLSALKVVCYYGCHISRPADVMQFDDPENPKSMDEMLEWTGVIVLDWKSKLDCCGAHFSLIQPDIVVELSKEIYLAALEVEADAVVVACPMCHANLDTRQNDIANLLGRPIDMPILYFSQVLGYALGLEMKQLGFEKHLIDPVPLMLEKCQSRQFAQIPHRRE